MDENASRSAAMKFTTKSEEAMLFPRMGHALGEILDSFVRRENNSDSVTVDICLFISEGKNNLFSGQGFW